MTLPFAIPTVPTSRLTLRGPRESDLDAMAAFGASPRSHFVGGPNSRREAWRVLLAGIGHWVLRGYGYWAVDRRADQAFVGRVGVIYPPKTPEPELVWHLFEGYEGQGFAFEAATAARSHAHAEMNLGPLVSFIDPGNAASLALARRMGAVHQGSFVEDGTDLQLWRHPGAQVPA